MKTYFIYQDKVSDTIKLYNTAEEAWSSNIDANILSVFEANEVMPKYYLIKKIEELIGKPVLVDGVFQMHDVKGVFKEVIKRPVSDFSNWKDYYVIEWTESEAGWGQRPDGFSIHETLEDARRHVKWMNEHKNYQEFSFPTDNMIRVYSMPKMDLGRSADGTYTSSHMSKNKLYGNVVVVDKKYTYPHKIFRDTGLMARI